MRLKLLIFDLDGTIADTIYSIRDGVNIAMKKYGLPTKTYEDVRKAIGNGARLLVKRCLPEEKQTDERFVTEVFEVYDKAFLNMYPTFVDDVNRLLREDKRIMLDGPEKLNSDLRILAFMRMGIDDSSRIAQILNYSVNTIYAYRNKLKMRAINTSTFEADVMRIPSI